MASPASPCQPFPIYLSLVTIRPVLIPLCILIVHEFSFSNSGLKRYSDIRSFRFIISAVDAPLLASVNKSSTIAAAL